MTIHSENSLREITTYTPHFPWLASWNSNFLSVTPTIGDRHPYYINQSKLAKNHAIAIQTLRELSKHLEKPILWDSLLQAIEVFSKARQNINTEAQNIFCEKISLDTLSLICTFEYANQIPPEIYCKLKADVWTLQLDSAAYPLIQTRPCRPLLFTTAKVFSSSTRIFIAINPFGSPPYVVVKAAACLSMFENDSDELVPPRYLDIIREASAIELLHKQLAEENSLAENNEESLSTPNPQEESSRDLILSENKASYALHIPHIPLGPVEVFHQNTKWLALVQTHYNCGALDKTLFVGQAKELYEASHQIIQAIWQYHRAHFVHHDVKRDNFFMHKSHIPQKQSHQNFEIILGDCESVITKQEAIENFRKKQYHIPRRFSRMHRLTAHCLEKPPLQDLTEDNFWKMLCHIDQIGAILAIIELTTNVTPKQWTSHDTFTCSTLRLNKHWKHIEKCWQEIGFSDRLIFALKESFEQVASPPSTEEILELF